MPSRGVPRGGSRKTTNVKSFRTGKTLTPKQVKAHAAKQKVTDTAKKIKKSPMAEDIRKGNLDNFNRIFRGKGKSPFGPVASGIVKPKPKPKTKPRGK